jgi:hypothetical protein
MTPEQLAQFLNLAGLMLRTVTTIDATLDEDLVQIDATSASVTAVVVAIANVLAVTLAYFIGNYTGLSAVQEVSMPSTPPKGGVDSMITVSTAADNSNRGVLQLPQSPPDDGNKGDKDSDIISLDPDL